MVSPRKVFARMIYAMYETLPEGLLVRSGLCDSLGFMAYVKPMVLVLRYFILRLFYSLDTYILLG